MAYEQWTIRVAPKLDKRVRNAAKRADMTLSQYVEWVMEQHLELAESAS